MSDDISIRVKNLGKMYRIYNRPEDRLKQMLWGRYRGQGYGRQFWALRDFNCTVHKGEMLGVIGRNGSGKSTLLQMLAGTLGPTTGQAELHGRVSALLELGSGFNPEYSGRDNVFIAGAILGIGSDEMRHRLSHILEFAGIGDFIDQPVKTYSSGMTVRLAFAVASSIDPDVLIVDEALAVGDMVFQQRCFTRFRQIRERGTSVLFVSHDLAAVVQYCDRAIVLDGGQMIGEGLPKTMVDLYKKSLAEQLALPESSAALPMQRNEITASGRLHERFQRNPNCQNYGDGIAEIVDWGVTDDAGAPLQALNPDRPITVVMHIHFHQTCTNPIAAFTIRDLRGNEICGTNTWFEDRPIGPMNAGQQIAVRFRFVLPLQTGGLALSLGCTEHIAGGLAVHHRLYDVLLLEMITTRRFVGTFDSHPEINITHHTHAA